MMELDLFDTESEIAFRNLCNKVKGCTFCSRMKDSQRVLNHSSGPLNAQIMFIGEAPGRLGADASEIPFHGDKAGHNFESLLEFANINRSMIFVTNAVLCNPRDEVGNNSTPTKLEIANCVKYLREQIDLVKPLIVVTLGAIALESVRLIEQHSYTLKESVRTINKWNNRYLIPLYHPGQRAMLHRSYANQRSDYQFINDSLRNLTKGEGKKKISTHISVNVSLIVEYLMLKMNSVSYFALHKLFYLIEYNAYKTFGYRLSDAYIIRQKDGPYCTDLHIEKLKKSIPGISVSYKGNSLNIRKADCGLFSESLLDEYLLEMEVANLIDEVINEHGKKSNAELKRTVYFTRPMRNILKVEKEMKINMYNSPIIFSKENVLV